MALSKIQVERIWQELEREYPFASIACEIQLVDSRTYIRNKKMSVQKYFEWNATLLMLILVAEGEEIC